MPDNQSRVQLKYVIDSLTGKKPAYRSYNTPAKEHTYHLIIANTKQQNV